jgi:hypothetical protein
VSELSENAHDCRAKSSSERPTYLGNIRARKVSVSRLVLPPGQSPKNELFAERFAQAAQLGGRLPSPEATWVTRPAFGCYDHRSRKVDLIHLLALAPYFLLAAGQFDRRHSSSAAPVSRGGGPPPLYTEGNAARGCRKFPRASVLPYQGRSPGPQAASPWQAATTNTTPPTTATHPPTTITSVVTANGVRTRA